MLGMVVVFARKKASKQGPTPTCLVLTLTAINWGLHHEPNYVRDRAFRCLHPLTLKPPPRRPQRGSVGGNQTKPPPAARTSHIPSCWIVDLIHSTVLLFLAFEHRTRTSAPSKPKNRRTHEMDAPSPRSSSMANHHSATGSDDGPPGTSPPGVPPPGGEGGMPYHPYSGGGGPGGYVGYYPSMMGHGMGGGYGNPYGGGGGGGPPPSAAQGGGGGGAYMMHPQHTNLPYGNHRGGGPPPPPPPSGMPSSPYGRSYPPPYDYYGGAPPSGGPHMMSMMMPPQPQYHHPQLQQLAPQPGGAHASPPSSSSSSPPSKSTRGGYHGGVGPSPRGHKDGSAAAQSLGKMALSAPTTTESRTDDSSPLRTTGSGGSGALDDEWDAEQRAKSSSGEAADADVELTPSNVTPLRSDFHFFVMETKDRIRLEAEKEVQASLRATKKSAADPMIVQYLVNTNLNARLMKEWEKLTLDDKKPYVKKEDDDRKRFMEEDEVASRHCATLTARVKMPGGGANGKDSSSSPGRTKDRAAGKDKIKSRRSGDDDDDDSDSNEDRGLQLQATESQEDEEDDADNDEGHDRGNEQKRPTGTPNDGEGSPPKKNRVDSDGK
jgi:hypothetical protein